MASIAKFDEWQNSAGVKRGTVLQVVQGTLASSLTITASTYVDVGLSATITPISTTSKILVITNMSVASSNAGTGKFFRLVRGGTAIGLGGSGLGGESVSFGDFVPQHSNGLMASLAFNFLDSPNTTSATTYKWTARSYSGVTFYVNRAVGSGASYAEPLSTITLMEIQA